MDQIVFATATELAEAIRRGRVSAVEVLEVHLEHIDRHNPGLNAIVTLDAEGARARARAADAALARGELWGPLHGVPLTLKDSHSTAGMRTTAGYPPLAGYVPSADGTVAARLRAAGAIILGKTNVPLLLADYQTHNPIFGRTNNPWDPGRTPGGSSGGAAAAVASGMVPAEVGSDFGGSIRVPAHFCGLFGLKPTERRVSLWGHIPDLPGQPRTMRIMTAIGPIARSPDDLSLLFGVLAGADAADPEVPPVPLRPVDLPDLRALRVAWVEAFPGMPVSSAIRRAVSGLAAALDRAGARVEERLPAVDWDAVREVGRYFYRSLPGVFASRPPEAPPLTVAEYLTQLHRRDDLIRTWEAFFTEWDVLIAPIASVAAFRHCETGTPLPLDEGAIPYWSAFSASSLFNLTGHPAVAVPVGQDGDGMPVGVQVVTRRWDDERLLAITRRLVEITGPFRRPPGCDPR